MRITQIMLGKGFGGAERSFVDTSLSLASRGHKVQAICHRKFTKHALLENVKNLELEAIRAGGELDFLTPLRIEKLIRQFKPEVVHTQLKRAAWHGGRAGFRARVPVVAKLHNYVSLDRYRYVHTLIGTTEDQRRYAIEQQWPENRVTVIPNFSRVPPAKEVRDFTSDTPINFLTYGRYVEVKGFDLLLRAFKQVLDAGIDARLMIGGGGRDSEALNRLAKDLNISEKVTLDVWIDDAVAALDNCDLFVLSSRSESFGIVLLEAMARGVPIISTKAKGPQQLLDNTTTFFADLDSVNSLAAAMLSASRNPCKAHDKAVKALTTYRTIYHESAVLPLLENLYTSVATDYRKIKNQQEKSC